VAKSRPNYEKPPVIEVVCGVLFKQIAALNVPYFGFLWQKFKSEFPKTKQAQPLAPLIERFNGESPPVEVEFTDMPPLPRIWFETADENGLIQVQQDRFHHNWKKRRDEDEYPHYEYVIKNFRRHLECFDTFLGEYALGSIEPLQYEMTYVNHIPQDEGWKSLSTLGELFPDFAWRGTKERFLPNFEAINWRTTFPLPDHRGRLHATIRLGTRKSDKRPVLLLELTARGIGKDSSRQEMWTWFDLAHEWIVNGFTDLTGEEVQRTVWKRLS
jgi:uncharacterized protein (TIGR04255 family)